MTALLTFIAVISALLSMFSVLFVFIQDLPTTVFILKRAIKLTFSEKEQEKSIMETTDFLNEYFKKTASKVVSSSDKELIKELDLSKVDVTEFKIKMKEAISNKETRFISEDIVKKMTTNYKSFNFVNLIVNDTRSMANDKAILLKKYTDLVKDNKMTKEEYMKEVWGLKGQSRKQAKARILQIERNMKNDKKNNVLPFAKNFVKEKWQNVAKEMYLISSKTELA